MPCLSNPLAGARQDLTRLFRAPSRRSPATADSRRDVREILNNTCSICLPRMEQGRLIAPALIRAGLRPATTATLIKVNKTVKTPCIIRGAGYGPRLILLE